MKRTLVAVLLLGALAGCATVSEVRTLGRYDFSYRIEGDARAAPLQIFDDGRQTYLVPDQKPLQPSNCKGFSRSSCAEEVMVGAGNDGESAEIRAV